MAGGFCDFGIRMCTMRSSRFWKQSIEHAWSKITPHPRPLSPEYRGEGRKLQDHEHRHGAALDDWTPPRLAGEVPAAESLQPPPLVRSSAPRPSAKLPPHPPTHP